MQWIKGKINLICPWFVQLVRNQRFDGGKEGRGPVARSSLFSNSDSVNVFWRDLAGLHCCHWLISEDLIPQTKVNKTKESADAYCSWHNLQSDAFMVIINENNCFFFNLLFGGTEEISIVHCSRLHRYRIFYPQTLSPDTFRNSELSGVWIYTDTIYMVHN